MLEEDEGKSSKPLKKSPSHDINMRKDLLIGGKVIKASYNSKVKERFVHVTEVTVAPNGNRRRFIVGVRPTELDRNGEWGAAVSILDAMLPFNERHPILASGDAGLCVEQHCEWLESNSIFYIWRIKQNAGGIYNKVIDLAEFTKSKCPEGDFFEQSRVSGSDVHSRRLWRLPDLQFSSYPGIKEGFVVEKTVEGSQEKEMQYYITSYPPQYWSSQEILDRILLHWDTETGVFGIKDKTFREDSVRYKSLQGARAHVTLLNFVWNFFEAPLLSRYWLNQEPISGRIQFFKDNPGYLPFAEN